MNWGLWEWVRFCWAKIMDVVGFVACLVLVGRIGVAADEGRLAASKKFWSRITMCNYLLR